MTRANWPPFSAFQWPEIFNNLASMYQKVKIVIGDKYGRLTPVAIAGKNRYGRTTYRCICDCGNEVVLEGSRIAHGTVKSCGCLKGYGVSHSITYSSWRGAKWRCSYVKHPYYKYYGGKGVKMCQRWLKSFENFLKDMGERPSPEYTLDRIDPSGDYTPENCRWATIREQCNNRRNNRILTYKGKDYTASNFAREFNIPPGGVYYGLKKGWEPEYIIKKYKNNE